MSAKDQDGKRSTRFALRKPESEFVISRLRAQSPNRKQVFIHSPCKKQMCFFALWVCLQLAIIPRVEAGTIAFVLLPTAWPFGAEISLAAAMVS